MATPDEVYQEQAKLHLKSVDLSIAQVADDIAYNKANIKRLQTQYEVLQQQKALAEKQLES